MPDYQQQELVFTDDRIAIRATGTQVMMAWERPLMKRMADIAAARRGDVLEVGFGMGLCARAVQKHRPRSHTIVECHPQIAARARAWAEHQPNVRILEGFWQEVVHTLGSFDGICFDVFGGNNQRLEFFSHLGALLTPAGTATLWLGDDATLGADLAAVLRAQGFRWQMSRVAAVPPPDCSYSAVNTFHVPAIFRAATP